MPVKITAQSTVTHCTGHGAQRWWVVEGLGYLDDDHSALTYIARRPDLGYKMEQVAEVPAEHQAAVDLLEQGIPPTVLAQRNLLAQAGASAA